MFSPPLSGSASTFPGTAEMDDFRVDLTGLDELRAKMQGLTNAQTKKAFKAALRKSAKVIADRAKVLAQGLDDPATGRSIASNIAIRPSRSYERRTGDLMMRVGVLGGAVLQSGDPDLKKKAPTPHWRLLEFGTSKMAAKPFLRPAMESSAQAVLEGFVGEAEKAVDQALRRAANGPRR